MVEELQVIPKLTAFLSPISQVFYYLSCKARRKFQKSPTHAFAMKETFPTPIHSANKICFAFNITGEGTSFFVCLFLQDVYYGIIYND